MDCKYCGNAMFDNQGRYECDMCGWTTAKPIENLDNLLYFTGEAAFYGGTAMPWMRIQPDTPPSAPVYFGRRFPKQR